MSLLTQLPEIGTAADFANMLNLLEAASYFEPTIKSRLEMPSSDSLDLINLGHSSLKYPPQTDLLNLLIRLFLLGEYASDEEIQLLVSPSIRQSLFGLGVLLHEQSDSGRVFASVAMYPVGFGYFISDRWNNPDLSPRPSFPDVVYPALTKSTQEFLRFLPFSPCEDFLEVCAGSGVAAILASRNAKNVCATDITTRSTHFANFNVALNAASNVTVLQGDLFEPCGLRRFDRIAAHPPYMPVLRPAEIYYDGGADGEKLTQLIVQGLPPRLKPGGRLYCRTLGSDRDGLAYEERVRLWLGESNEEFDVAFFVSKNLDVTRFALDSAIRKSSGQEEVNAWLSHFKRLAISELLSGILILQRRIERRKAFTMRRSLSPSATLLDTETVLNLQTLFSGSANENQIFNLRPVVVPTLRFVATHLIEKGDVSLETFKITNEHPFLMDLATEPWVGRLIALCDGSRSIRNLYEDSRQQGWMNPALSMAEFGELTALLVSSGFLHFPPSIGIVEEG